VRPQQQRSFALFKAIVQPFPVLGQDDCVSFFTRERRYLEKLDRRLADVAKDPLYYLVDFLLGLGVAERHPQVLPGDPAVPAVEHARDVAKDYSDPGYGGRREKRKKMLQHEYRKPQYESFHLPPAVLESRNSLAYKEL
jgi:hypothetical protein